jgi:thymidylate synthase
MLARDKLTRRCIVRFKTLKPGEVPCLSFCNILVRNGRLNMVVHTRSEDLTWGFPYDTYFFQTYQMILAGLTGFDIGTYTHLVTSLHLYKDTLDKTKTEDIKDIPFESKMSIYAFNNDVISLCQSLSDNIRREYVSDFFREASKIVLGGKQ